MYSEDICFLYGIMTILIVAYITPSRQEFYSGGVQQIQWRTEDRENGDPGGGSPLVRGSGGS